MVSSGKPRDPIAGPDTVEPPFPLKLRGPVIQGFGRGSKELGIPTANIPLSGLSVGGNDNLDSGIYYGFASLDHSSSAALPASSTAPSKSSNHAVSDLEEPATASPSRPLTPSATTAGRKVYPAVLSIGYNPVYKNTTRSIEIHLLHSFADDFYGATLSLVILGYIRPEFDYVSKEALVEDIREDVRVAQRSLEREAYAAWRADGWLFGERGEAQDEDGEVVVPLSGDRGPGQTGGVGISMAD